MMMHIGDRVEADSARIDDGGAGIYIRTENDKSKQSSRHTKCICSAVTRRDIGHAALPLHNQSRHRPHCGAASMSSLNVNLDLDLRGGDGIEKVTTVLVIRGVQLSTQLLEQGNCL